MNPILKIIDEGKKRTKSEFDAWFKEYPGVPTVGEIQDFIDSQNEVQTIKLLEALNSEYGYFNNGCGCCSGERVSENLGEIINQISKK